MTDGEDSPIFKKLEAMDNKLERIKSDTHNLNRIACLSNSRQIITELWKAVGNSEVRAAILMLTKEEISAPELVQKLGISGANLAMYMKPFTGNKGIIAELRKKKNKYFQRSELVDLVGFENEEEFVKLTESWQKKQGAKQQAVGSTAKEDASAT